MKTERKVLKLDRLPEGNRLLEYCRQLDEIIKNNKDSFRPFLERIYEDCRVFLLSQHVSWLPTTKLFLVPVHAKYLAIEKEKTEHAIQKEAPIGQTYGFVVGNRFNKDIYIDMELHINLLEHGAATFVIGLVETFIHELLHSVFNEKLSEQEDYEMQCKAVEGYLGIKYPSDIKNRRASDYYKSD